MSSLARWIRARHVAWLVRAAHRLERDHGADPTVGPVVRAEADRMRLHAALLRLRG